MHTYLEGWYKGGKGGARVAMGEVQYWTRVEQDWTRLVRLG